jgi:hypothetical protein
VQFTNNLSKVYDPEVGSGGFIWTGRRLQHLQQHMPSFFPNDVAPIHAFLRRGMPKEGTTLQHDYAYVRNVAYNVQYLEYLSKLIDADLEGEENLHFTVTTLTYKTFVITGMGVVEAVLWYLLKHSGNQRASVWEQTLQVASNQFQQDGQSYKLETVFFKKRDVPEDDEMTLDSMIKKVEKKNLLGGDHTVYEGLNHLRKLRNRVHIRSVQHDKDTDWWSFELKHVKLMKGVLYRIFNSTHFHPEQEHDYLLEFLKVEEAPEQLDDDI